MYYVDVYRDLTTKATSDDQVSRILSSIATSLCASVPGEAKFNECICIKELIYSNFMVIFLLHAYSVVSIWVHLGTSPWVSNRREGWNKRLYENLFIVLKILFSNGILYAKMLAAKFKIEILKITPTFILID